MLYTIVGDSYGECTYAEIAKKLEKISHNNKVWRIRKSEIGRNTFVVKATNNPLADDMREELVQMTTEQEFVLKHVSGG